MSEPVLHMLCGKIAAGKSTLSATLGQGAGVIVIREDDWLHALYSDRLETLADYSACTARLREIVGPLSIDLLRAGTSVVLDFAANRPPERAWMRGLAQTAGAQARLHYLEVDDATCLTRLRARNARGEHPFRVSEAQFHRITSHFVPPTEEEGLDVIRYAP
ncbi:ATP-binding protein [uncultured Lentibacter sp.]|uniref:AAA family ATPase n=1 Tax=uncultured Lentibacter sp. TaxID=1659309 RepID=UPI002607374E|nr:ATP-binding protein [uncultured Lentibacter sp.]